jgi:hypothetical protein
MTTWPPSLGFALRLFAKITIPNEPSPIVLSSDISAQRKVGIFFPTEKRGIEFLISGNFGNHGKIYRKDKRKERK